MTRSTQRGLHGHAKERRCMDASAFRRTCWRPRRSVARSHVFGLATSVFGIAKPRIGAHDSAHGVYEHLLFHVPAPVASKTGKHSRPSILVRLTRQDVARDDVIDGRRVVRHVFPRRAIPPNALYATPPAVRVSIEQFSPLSAKHATSHQWRAAGCGIGCAFSQRSAIGCTRMMQPFGMTDA